MKHEEILAMMAKNSRMFAAIKSMPQRDKWLEDAYAQEAGARAIIENVALRAEIEKLKKGS